MNMGEARRKELEFFQKSKDYGALRNIGTGYLSSNLSDRLINAVRRQLPNISTFVNKRCGWLLLGAAGRRSWAAGCDTAVHARACSAIGMGQPDT